MIRAWSLACFVLLLAACSGGASNSATPPPRAATLVAFDTEGLDQGVELPDVGAYWRGAEARNGNTHPFRARIAECQAIIRINAAGGCALLKGGKFETCTAAALTIALQNASTAHWNEGAKASYANVVLFADKNASMRAILETCEKLTHARMANLLLVTRDGKETRLLPLFIDIAQAKDGVYSVPKSDWPKIAHLRLSTGPQRKAVMWQLDKSYRVEGLGNGWGKAICADQAVKKAPIERLQLDLPPEAKLSDAEECIKELAPRGIARLELFIPALYRKADAPADPDAIEFPEYKDTFEIGRRVLLPSLTQFWADGRNAGVKPPAKLNDKDPVLAIVVSPEGKFSSRIKDQSWLEHSEDATLMRVLHEVSEAAYDADATQSRSQVVLGLDGRAPISCVLAIQNLLRKARLRYLYLLTLDSLGPVARLMDISLSPTIATDKLATLKITSDANKQSHAEFCFEGKVSNVEGEAWLTDLSRAAMAASSRPAALDVSANAAPISVLFLALDALTPLGMREVRFVP